MSRSLEKYHEIRQLSQYRTREIDSTEAEHYITVKDDRGMLCIHWAMLYHDSDVINVLLRSGADINAQTENGFTPLHLALLKSDNNIDVKNFTEDKYYNSFPESSVLHRVPNKLKTILTSLQRPKVDLKDSFGLNPVMTAYFFRNSTSLVLLDSLTIPPRVIIDYILVSSYSYFLPSATSKRSEKFCRVLATQVKQGILPRNANFLTITEPQNIQEISNLIFHTDLQLYIVDVTVGLPNSLLTFFLLIERERISFLITRDVKYKAIQESLPDLSYGDRFSWVSAIQHLNLLKYLKANLIISNKFDELYTQIRRILDYTGYLSVFIDLKLSTSNKPNEAKILDSLMYSTISLLITLWLGYRNMSSYSELRGEVTKVANSLNKLSAKYGRSIYHWILSYDYLSFSRTDGISFLLENDFDCNIRTKEANGKSVLSFAYNKQETGVCLLLLRHGAYPLSINRFEVSFMDEVVKCPTVLPFVKLKRDRITQSKEFIRAISRDPVLKNIWVNFSQLPYKLSTLTAQCIVKYNLPYTDLTSSLVAFVKLHDPKKYECWK